MWISLDNGFEVDIGELPITGQIDKDNITVEEVGNLLAVGYIIHDDGPADDWLDLQQNNEGHQGRLKVFRSQVERDEFIDEIEAEKKICFIVDKYEHSAVHYSVANSIWLPDRQWDVAPSGVFVLPDDLQKQYHKRKYAVSRAGARQELVSVVNSILDEYSMWCNGEIYGVVTFVPGEKDLEDSCWGFVGHEYALEMLKEEFMPGIIELATKRDTEIRQRMEIFCSMVVADLLPEAA